MLNPISSPSRYSGYLISMLIITFFFSFYIAAQFLGAGKVLSVTFGLDPTWGMPLAAAKPLPVSQLSV